MFDNKPVKDRIISIRIDENKKIFYTPYIMCSITLEECNIGATKRELLNSFLTKEDKL